MADYSREDIASMQEDALRRVRDMQRQMQEKLGRAPQPSSEERFSEEQQNPLEPSLQDASDGHDSETEPDQEDFEPQTFSEQTPQNSHRKAAPKPSPMGNWIKSFTKMDNDNLFLLLLILLLQRENVDQTLILALFYIML